jgi:homoserine dehydrogenase
VAFRAIYNESILTGENCIRTYNLCVVGFGNVGKAFVALLERKKGQLQSRYGVACRVTGVASRRLGWLVAADGFDSGKVLAGDFSQAQHVRDIREWLRMGAADAVFETSSLNAATGRPAVDYLRTALEMGAHAISANKGPVVYAYRELSELASTMGRRFLFESAVMDGVPIFSLFREAMPAVAIRGFRGVLNSTTNVILEGMESGLSFDDAVKKAQELGVAESDPSDDIDGVDAAVKVVALANVLMNAELKLSDVQRHGIRDISSHQLRHARDLGHAWKLVCSANRETNGSVVAHVRLEPLKSDDPLAQVHGTSSVISFETDVLPQLIITEQDPSLETTAYGLLADFLTAVRSA